MYKALRVVLQPPNHTRSNSFSARSRKEQSETKNSMTNNIRTKLTIARRCHAHAHTRAASHRFIPLLLSSDRVVET